jgi:hypothetical protein
VAPITNSEPSYRSTTIWRDRQAFDNWRNGSAFQKAHGQKPSESKDSSSKSDENEKPKEPPAPLWSQPPQPIFYEGTLVIASKDGA